MPSTQMEVMVWEEKDKTRVPFFPSIRGDFLEHFVDHPLLVAAVVYSSLAPSMQHGLLWEARQRHSILTYTKLWIASLSILNHKPSASTIDEPTLRLGHSLPRQHALYKMRLHGHRTPSHCNPKQLFYRLPPRSCPWTTSSSCCCVVAWPRIGRNPLAFSYLIISISAHFSNSKRIRSSSVSCNSFGWFFALVGDTRSIISKLNRKTNVDVLDITKVVDWLFLLFPSLPRSSERLSCLGLIAERQIMGRESVVAKDKVYLQTCVLLRPTRVKLIESSRVNRVLGDAKNRDAKKQCQGKLMRWISLLEEVSYYSSSLFWAHKYLNGYR